MSAASAPTPCFAQLSWPSVAPTGQPRLEAVPPDGVILCGDDTDALLVWLNSIPPG